MANNYGDPVWIPDVLRKAGLKCNEFPGWRDRGHGDFGTIWGIIDHHTGSFGETPNGIANHPSLGLASQLYLGKNGEFTMCGVGIAWHAGVGSWKGIPINDANSCTIGIEAAHDGTSPWGSAQYNSYVKGNAAILKHMGYNSDRSIGHKEWGAIQGKWDPGNIDMIKFRREIQAEIKGAPSLPVVNMINECLRKNPWLGKRLTKETNGVAEVVVGSDKKGRAAEFEGGAIYWHPSVGAHAIPGPDPKIRDSGILLGFHTKGGLAKLGYPVRDFTFIQTKTFKGAVQAFQNGVLYIRDGYPATLVGGVIGQRWAKDGYEQGRLGWPVTDEMDNGTGGRIQQFENGTLEWDPSGAVLKIGEAARDLTLVDDKGIPLAVDAVKAVPA